MKLKEKELEQKRVEVEKIKKLQEEESELNFELWINKLPKNELEAIYKGSEYLKPHLLKIKTTDEYQRNRLKEYFIENV